MIQICVEIDVENHKEVIKSKGKAYGYFTNFISNEAVETEIKKQVIKKLKESLAVELKDNGVKSIIRIK